MAVTLRERRLARRERERHVEDIDVVLAGLDDDRGGLGDRGDQRVDLLAHVVVRRALRGVEVDDEERVLLGGGPKFERRPVAGAPAFEVGQQVGLGLLGVSLLALFGLRYTPW